MIKQIKSLPLLSLLILIISISCTKEKLPDNILATVDEHQISISDFKRAYLPVLLYSDKPESPQTREEVLNFLIEQTMLAQEARSLELDTIPTLDVLRRTAEKTAFTRILYREWVKDLVVTPSEATLRSAFQKSHNPRLVRHLFLNNQSDAQRIYQELSHGANWDSLAALSFDDEYLAANGGVLGWMKFGEMDPWPT